MSFIKNYFGKKKTTKEISDHINYDALCTIDKIAYIAFKKFPMILLEPSDRWVKGEWYFMCGDTKLGTLKGSRRFSVEYKGDYLGFTQDGVLSRQIHRQAEILATDWLNKLDNTTSEDTEDKLEKILEELEDC